MRTDRARQEFELFVAHATKDLLRTAYLVAWDLSTGEDLVQECLLRVARRWPRVRAMQYPEAYARRVLLNLALDGAKSRGRDRAELGAERAVTLQFLGDAPAAVALGAVDNRDELVTALGALAPRQRAVLVLRYLEDLSEAQTAQALGCSVGTVKNTASHALEKLRRLMAITTQNVEEGRLPASLSRGDN